VDPHATGANLDVCKSGLILGRKHRPINLSRHLVCFVNMCWVSKGKFRSITGHEGTGLDVQLYCFFNPGGRWGGWSTPSSGPFTLRKQTWYPLPRRPGGPQVRSEWVRKISPPPGFDPQVDQPVASRCTDYLTNPYKTARSEHVCGLHPS